MSRKMTLPNLPAPVANRGARSYGKLQEMDFDKMYKAMEKGHRVCKMSLLKKWDPAYKLLCLKLETRLLVMNKLEQGAVRNKPTVLDIRTIREVQTLEFKQSEIKIADKWRRDKEIQNFDAAKILVISHGTGFTLQYWILLFESVDTCRLWSKGVHNLMLDTRDRDSSCHTTRIDRFLSRHFDDLRSPINDTVARKHMKPFVQTSLQFKVQSKQLQETTEDQMDVKQFMKAAKQIIHVPTLFQSLFNEYSDDGVTVSFANFLRFLQQKQNEESAGNRQKVVDLLRRFLHQDQAFNHERIEPTLSVMEFCDFLFSRENSLWDPMNEKVIQDMSKPLSHYWIASSHNTYLTGDQLRSESSLDCYAQALLMGCRCIELDCWDGQKKPGSQEFQDIVIYHGYTMTSKLLLRDVLFTIKHYAFINSEYPVILSIEDNCSVPAQRLLASEVKEILGDYLLTQPVHRDETALPSPASIKKKIILKHKKLTVETADGKTPVAYDEFEDNDSIVNSKDCIKKGILYLKDMTIHDWKPHVFILFQDRLCFLMDTCTEDESQDTISMAGDDEKEEDALAGFGVRPEEQHVTEEWFHGRCERDQAASRLLQYKEKGNGLFMIRDSNLFIGDFSLSILHDGKVHHVRIRTKMVEREKKYYFMDNKVCDTLYELVSYYTRHYLTTPNFRMALTIACPQPQPHLNEPWFHTTADKSKAEELLNRRNEDGAFLIRMSSSDENVFVLSIRVDGELWHYRLKRDGRLFVVNQTAFENLNQIVEYYSTREFVRGISLRYPVNENDLNGTDMDVGVVTPGNYFDIRELEKPVLARAIRPHHGQGEDEITFPIDAMITVLNKDGDLWRGRYGSTTGFFRATCVQEIIGEKHSNQSDRDMSGTRSYSGCTILKTMGAIYVLIQAAVVQKDATPARQGKPLRPQVIHIFPLHLEHYVDAYEPFLNPEENVHRDETALPSPASIKKKIILKHKKLTVETADGKTPVAYDEFEDNDSIVNSKDCIKKGILYLKDMTIHDWKPHVFILFQDRLCFLMDTCTEDESQDTISMAGDDEKEEDALAGFGVRPEEQHVTEEWFHGRCERDQAASRLLQYKEKGNGLFMIRDSNLFIGDFSLSILHDGKVHHVRIRTKMVEKEKKYYFMDNKVCDTLYELVSYYTRHYLTTPNFRMALTIACPQPQPHLNEPVDGELWHYRLKRDGRLFVVNQTAFENLNQIVEYYSTREFVRGISLRYPVNENDLNGTDMDVGVVTPGNYFDIRELEKPVLARAIRPHHGQGEDEITFPIDAMITVLNKDGDLWRGRYGSTTGFFRATCVQEIIGEKHSNQSESNYNTIELVGTAIERTGEPDKPFALKIKTAYNGQEWMLAASAREDIEDWFNYLVDNTKTANDKFHQIRSKEKERKIAAELSNLVVYCQAVPFDPAHIENGSFYEMCSFVENKLDKLLEKGLVQFNMKQLSRVYPNGSRITSTNYNPVPMWNSACHMVALNYQTGDRAMQVNQGKFMSNGQCGFILKPKYMIDTAFDPLQANRASSSAVRVCMKIIAGRHLSRKDKNKGICSPFVEIEVIGLQWDERTFKSRTIASNGLNPMWNETFTFDVQFPELTMLRFHVEDGDFVGPKTDPFIGQSVLSLDSVRCGYRSVPLKNSFSEELELSALLIDLQMFRIDNTTLIQSARTVLQADRLAAKYNRTLTGTKSSASVASAPMKIAPQIGSRDHGSMESGMESPTTCSPLLNEEVNRMSVVSMNMSMNGISMDSQDSDHTASAPPSLPTTPSTPGTPSAKTKKKGILSKFFNR